MAKINVPIICGYTFHHHIGHYDFKAASLWVLLLKFLFVVVSFLCKDVSTVNIILLCQLNSIIGQIVIKTTDLHTNQLPR